MTDRPIIFSAPMVRALLAGRKTQTRRVMKPQPYIVREESGRRMWNASGAIAGIIACSDAHLASMHRFRSGDRLYVREAWAPLEALTHNDPGTQALADRGFYRADEGTVDGEISRWRPSIHMPRWASRLTLTVTDVRVQRLQEISEEDAVAEGVQREEDRYWHDYLMPSTQLTLSAKESFASLWNSINGPYAWAANPWVVPVTFDVIRANIDALPAGEGA